jgi:hypothetical protein
MAGAKNGAKRMECVELAPAFSRLRVTECESAGKPGALQMLRAFPSSAIYRHTSNLEAAWRVNNSESELVSTGPSNSPCQCAGRKPWAKLAHFGRGAIAQVNLSIPLTEPLVSVAEELLSSGVGHVLREF